jgi:hypothetical protein
VFGTGTSILRKKIDRIWQSLTYFGSGERGTSSFASL